MKTGVRCALAAAGLWVLAGCGGDPCPTGGQGSLELTVSGLPEGVAPSITLAGPAAERTATGSATLEALESGKWTIRAAPIAAPGGMIRRAYDAPSAEVCILADDTSPAAVTYAEVPTSAKLWMNAQSSVGRFLGYAADAIGATASVSPAVGAYVKPEVPGGAGVAFDKRGNMWVADHSGSVKRLPASTLSTTGFADADVIITSFEGGVPGPTHLAFDAQDNLWVSVAFSKKIVRFRPDQLTASGSPTAAVEITGDAAPGVLAFDGAGNLWVGTGKRLLKYAAGRLDASLSAPDLSINPMTSGPSINSLGGPSGLAFDADGNLWGAFFGANVIARFTPADLAGSGLAGSGEVQVTPTVQLTIAVNALLDALVFDEQGGLWTPLASRSFGRIAPSQRESSGSVSPEVIITSQELSSSASFAVYPAPAFTPLYHRLP